MRIPPIATPHGGATLADGGARRGGSAAREHAVPPPIEAPDTAPYFHDNSALTLENALSVYLGGEFNGSPAAHLMENVDDPPGFGVMRLNDAEVQAIAASLRVVNAIQIVRSA